MSKGARTRTGSALLIALTVVGPTGAAFGAEDAATSIVFELQDNARCQTLSPGGKMTLVRNAHPTRAIRYQFVRYFADAPQPGRVDGVLEPGQEPVAIGCNRVDDRPQEWRVKRARFVDE